MKVVVVAVLALGAAFAGFYGALALTVWIGGLDVAHVVPPAGLAGAGLLAGVVAAIAWPHSGAGATTLVLGPAAAGAVVGFTAEALGLNLTWIMAGGVLIVAATVTIARVTASAE